MRLGWTGGLAVTTAALTVAATLGACGQGEGGADTVPGRVLDAVAPVGASSLPGLDSVWRQIAERRASGAHACLRDAGRADLISAIDKQGNAMLGMYYADYPDPVRLRKTGFKNLAGPVPALSAADEKLLEQCRDHKGDDTHDLETKFGDLAIPWLKLQNVAYSSTELDGVKRDFMTCLGKNGVPVAKVRSADLFTAWVTGEESRGASEQQSAAYAKLYADCGEPWFSARERLMVAKRPDFVRNHEADLAHLAGLLAK
jgi:hypothetical protein